MLLSRAIPVFGLIAAAAVLPVAVAHFIGGEEPSGIAPIEHLLMVGLGAAVAAGASIALAIAGVRRRDSRSVLVAVAFAAMTAMLAIHGLATPGVVVGPNGVIAMFGGAALPVGGAVLAVAAVIAPDSHRVGRVLAAGIALVTLILVVGTVGLLVPDAVPAVPKNQSTAALVVLVAGLIFYTLLAVRAARTFLLTRRLSDLAVVVGLVWLGVALVLQLQVETGSWAWWVGHWLELIGVGLVAGPVALDLYRAGPSKPLLGDLQAGALVAQEESFLGARVRALMVRLGEKDGSTEGHTRRVASLAVRVGEELGLTRGRLRELALGGLLHDMGKLRTPDAILLKPSGLTAEEFAVIRRHPGDGDRLLTELGGFSPAVRRLVRDHHERLDGSGYPAALTADQIPLEVRILAVCDVYDALTSPRVYREAWDRERALALLRDESPRAFDTRCVEALASVVEDPAPTAAPPARGRRAVPA